MINGLYTLSELQVAVARDPLLWRPIAFTNGCFDLLHAGHVRYLNSAKSFGQSLIVGLNSDKSVQALKPQQAGAPKRPIVPEMQRAEILCALKPVDAVVIFSDTTATKTIQAIEPDIYVKGGDYSIETLPEAPAVRAYGGRIIFYDFEISISTTAIINRILQT